ncbi:MAG: hypothetical protein L6275_04725, partial [Candidatus Portnoybacteria bacterium]|nr:hypothetical protein [Candidatus Portnoybacteria bacterium]
MSNKIKIIICFLSFISCFLAAGGANADYYNEGILKSTNVLSGATVSAITGFRVTSAMEATASTSVQFSQDRVNFYNSSGVKGGWDICSDGTTIIDISGLGWSGGILFYKLKLRTYDALTTPTTTDIQVDYDGTEVPADSGVRYPNEGTLVSTDLLAGLSGNLNGSEKFGYNISSLPAGTAVYAQFSQDGENWYNSSGTKWGWDTLSAGSHLEAASALGLSGLGWSGDNFYYKLKFTSIDGEQTPAVSEISLLKSATQINAPITNKSSGGLVGDWTFNGPDMDWASTTAEALDRSGEANNGNVIGAKAAIGISGQGLEFDGADDYI